MSANVPTIQELQSYEMIAKQASNAKYWQSLGGPEGIMSIMLVARELGVSPMLALTGGFHNIQGKVEISGRLMNQLIRQRGHHLKTIICNDLSCKLWGKRKDTGEEMEVVYTMEEAKRSGLIRSGSAWMKTPSDMLFWRALSRIGRRLFPDCIGTCYVEGELQEAVLKEAVATSEPKIQNEVIEISAFILPEEEDETLVDEYFSHLANHYEKDKNAIKKQASANPDGFWKNYHAWLDKRMQETEQEIATEMAV